MRFGPADYEKREDITRDRIQRRLKIPLEAEARIRVGKAKRTSKFDFASPDRTVVGQIKGSDPPIKGRSKGNARPTQLAEFSRDCLLMLAVRKARTRLFVLTNERLYDRFRGSVYGEAAKAMKIVLVLCAPGRRIQTDPPGTL